MRNKDGYYIIEKDRWQYYEDRPTAYRIKKIRAFLWLVIPIAGFVMCYMEFKDMGLSIFL